MTPSTLEDRLSLSLKADGVGLEPRYLTPGNPESMQIGYSFIQDGVEFICRVDEADKETVVLVFYGLSLYKAKQGCNTRGLKSGFAELMWLLNYLQSKGFRRIKGYIWKDTKQYPKGAALERMQTFYEKMGAKPVIEGQQPFIIYDLRLVNNFRDIKMLLKRLG